MVIDASVAAKWFLKDAEESDTDLAEDILLRLLSGELELHAPRVFTYEFCHVLTKACLTKSKVSTGFRLAPSHAQQCISELFRLRIRVEKPSEEEGREALAMAVKHSKKHADMTYIRLAEIFDCQWCTADEKLLRALRPSFPRHRILELSSMRPVG